MAIAGRGSGARIFPRCRRGHRDALGWAVFKFLYPLEIYYPLWAQMPEQHSGDLRSSSVSNFVPLRLEPLPHLVNDIPDLSIISVVLQLHTHGNCDSCQEQYGEGGNESDAPEDHGVRQLLIPIRVFSQNDIIHAVVAIVVVVKVVVIVWRVVALALTAVLAVPVVLCVLLVVVRREVDDVPTRPDRCEDRGHEQRQEGRPDIRTVWVEDVPRQRVDAELEGCPCVVRHGQAPWLRLVEARRLIKYSDGGRTGEAARAHLAAYHVISLHGRGDLVGTDEGGPGASHDGGGVLGGGGGAGASREHSR